MVSCGRLTVIPILPIPYTAATRSPMSLSATPSRVASATVTEEMAPQKSAVSLVKDAEREPQRSSKGSRSVAVFTGDKYQTTWCALRKYYMEK
jgi:hypothetical protein